MQEESVELRTREVVGWTVGMLLTVGVFFGFVYVWYRAFQELARDYDGESLIIAGGLFLPLTTMVLLVPAMLLCLAIGGAIACPETPQEEHSTH